MEGIKPATGLIHTFCDEVGGEGLAFFYFFFGLKGVVPLGIRHGTGIKPHVDEVKFPFHGLTLGRNQNDIVDVRAVQVFGHLLVETEGSVGFFYFTFEFGYAIDADFFGGIIIAPDGQGYAPVARAGEVPVL